MRCGSIIVDLYVLAMRCDLVRFGNLMVISGGDAYPFSSPVGSIANIHGLGFHQWSDPAIQPLVADDIRWTMTKTAAVLAKLDDPVWKDVDGGSLLDNTCRPRIDHLRSIAAGCSVGQARSVSPFSAATWGRSQ